MAGLNLGPAFNAELVALAGWSPDTVDPTTLDVAYVNPGGPTTVRAVATANVPTDALSVLIRKHTPASDPTD